MSKAFGFSVSWADMIRKLRYRYEHPADYLDAIVSRLYSPGVVVDFGVYEERVKFESTGSIDAALFEDIRRGDIMAVASVLPPVDEYATIKLASGHQGLFIDESRDRTLFSLHVPVQGTVCMVERKSPVKTYDASEIPRLNFLYGGSDLSVQISGSPIAQISGGIHSFEKDGVSGTVAYDPRSSGGLHFYDHGRFISSVPLVPALDIRLHQHGFSSTVTKTRTILTGRASGEYERLKEVLPEIVLEYLCSPEVEGLQKSSNSSFHSLLRVVSEAYPGDSGIGSYVKSHTLHSPKTPFFNLPGTRKLNKVGDILGLEGRVAVGDGFEYQSDRLIIPRAAFLHNDPHVLAAAAVQVVSQDTATMLELYNRIVEHARK
jgi:hypothetical protein